MTPGILVRYLAKTWCLHFLGLTLLLLGIVYLFDTIELLRRASENESVTLRLVLWMGIYKLPEVGQIILPFSILYSGLYTFWQLNRRHELVVIRSSGFSSRHFLLPFLVSAFLIGCVHVALINPLGAVLIARFETLESRYLNTQASLVSMFKQGIWPRQSASAGGEIVLHARKIKLPEWELQDVLMLEFDAQNRFVRRIDAAHAVLRDRSWSLGDVAVHSGGAGTQAIAALTIPTTITRKEIEESFASPETVPFWRLPSYITMLKTTGFDSTPMQMHFYYLLALPFLFTAMILLAACLSLRPPRQGGAAAFAGAGILIGIGIFFFSSFLQALGLSHQLPPLLAAWAPAAATLLIGFSIILHQEDG